jgi:hypothetical protein
LSVNPAPFAFRGACLYNAVKSGGGVFVVAFVAIAALAGLATYPIDTFVPAALAVCAASLFVGAQPFSFGVASFNDAVNGCGGVFVVAGFIVAALVGVATNLVGANLA